jgi:hypothetical protein
MSSIARRLASGAAVLTSRLPGHLKGRCPQEVIDGLEGLLAEFPARASYISNMLMYAEIGKDRASLNMGYVDSVRQECEEMDRAFGRAAA